ncbi:hypothetical protein [Streptomyces olindensis]|uniref:hypothetical protein n=1 Tax=Streptomyces olindensis TaxID=358823 RepID=UPI0033FAC48C
MRTTAALVAIILTGVTVAACGDDTPPSSTKTVTETVTATPTDTPTTPTDDAQTSSEEASDATLTLTESYKYENGVQLSLTDITRAVSSDTASPSNTPYARFNLKVVNETSQILDLGGLTVQCQYGEQGQEGDEIFDSARGLEGAPSTHLRPGRTITALFGCQLPRDESYLQVEVAPDYDMETAIFAGSVK